MATTAGYIYIYIYIYITRGHHRRFLHNISGNNSIVNTMAINDDNVLVSGSDNGMLHFWDWKSGHNFHTSETVAQPGSLESEKGIYAMKFDLSGSRLITCEACPRYPNPLTLALTLP